MDERSPADNSGQDTGEQPEVPGTVLLASEQIQATDNCAQKKEECENKKSYWKSFQNAGADRHIELLLGVLIASFACFQLIASCNNSRSSTTQMQNLQTAADRIDDAAESFSKSSADVSRSMGDAVAKLQTQAEKMDAARMSSEKNSTQALQATIDNFHLDQRAWIGAKGPIDIEFSVAPNPISARLSMTNYGKTPAKHVIAINFLHTADAPIDPVEYMKSPVETGGEKSWNVIFPTQSFELHPSTGSTEELGVEKTRSGKKILYLFVVINYDDVFGKQHVTRMCARYNATVKAFSTCPGTYDYAN